MTAEDRGLQNNLEGNINEDDEPKINLPRGGTINRTYMIESPQIII